jgi:hypothetical protein
MDIEPGFILLVCGLRRRFPRCSERSFGSEDSAQDGPDRDSPALGYLLDGMAVNEVIDQDTAMHRGDLPESLTKPEPAF